MELYLYIGTDTKEQICSVTKMADPIEELDAVFMTCGINNAGMCANIIA
jgi:hypothetical protein